MANTTSSMSPQDYCNMRDALYNQILAVGKEHGFNDVSLTVKDTLESGEKFEWEMKISFRREK